jgi:hypothetical protein
MARLGIRLHLDMICSPSAGCRTAFGSRVRKPSRFRIFNILTVNLGPEGSPRHALQRAKGPKRRRTHDLALGPMPTLVDSASRVAEAAYATPSVSADSPLNPSREHRQRPTASPAAARPGDAQCSSSSRAGWGGVRCRANGACREGDLQVAMPWALRTPWLQVRDGVPSGPGPAQLQPDPAVVQVTSGLPLFKSESVRRGVQVRSDSEPEHFTVHTACAQRVYGAVPPAIPRWTGMGQSCGP